MLSIYIALLLIAVIGGCHAGIRSIVETQENHNAWE